MSGEERPLLVPTISPVSVLQASQNLTEKLKELTQLTQQTVSVPGECLCGLLQSLYRVRRVIFTLAHMCMHAHAHMLMH